MNDDPPEAAPPIAAGDKVICREAGDGLPALGRGPRHA
jgi:hypothetical protein